MKIKCPGCATVLQVPESAAGKVVKCKCGKQFRVPGGSPAAAQATGQPAAKAAPASPARPQASSAQAARTQPAPTQAAPANPYSHLPGMQAPPPPSFLDELTESDFSGVKSVQVPGRGVAAAAPGASAAKLLDEAMSGGAIKRQGSSSDGPRGPRPGFLTFLGVINGIAAFGFVVLCLLFAGLIGASAQGQGQDVEIDGVLFAITMVIFGALAVLSLATTVACFVPVKASWYVMLISYGWAVSSYLFEAIQTFSQEDADTAQAAGKLVGRMVFSIGIWAWLHKLPVRSYYGTTESPTWVVIGCDVFGFLLGTGLGVAALALA
ncbi:hypothetical protein [Rhodopirellula sp. MGV]|uniref:hypothetical protein n=1 Tax=Rhodopirellula sp. MGV TaxID=2023130 RepID=UPI000B95EB8B|nr:hypothetical protein [Rhodopirellula sp. MGV]OYP29502.1 hypothetical protein CGZ80_24425 [Rhodopirellula sp. MGV]PNY33806.1 hypothetical protein C2E31_27360 [Rhodopirellula baltica]